MPDRSGSPAGILSPLADRVRELQVALDGAGVEGTEDAIQRVIRASEAAREAAEEAMIERAAASAPIYANADVAGASRHEFPAHAPFVNPDRLARARQRVEEETQMMALSARVPLFLDQYVSAFVARANARRRTRTVEVTKQQVVAEALCLFAAIYSLPPAPEDSLL